MSTKHPPLSMPQRDAIEADVLVKMPWQSLENLTDEQRNAVVTGVGKVVAALSPSQPHPEQEQRP